MAQNQGAGQGEKNKTKNSRLTSHLMIKDWPIRQEADLRTIQDIQDILLA
jgi:hypothetical protein